MKDSLIVYLVEKWTTPEINSSLERLFSNFWSVKSPTITRLNRYFKENPAQLAEYETYFEIENGKTWVIHDTLDGSITLNGEKMPSYHFAESKIAEVCRKLEGISHGHAD